MNDLNVLIPIDPTDGRTAPLRMAGQLAQRLPVHARLLHVFQPPTFPNTPMGGVGYYAEFYAEQRKAFEEQLAAFAQSEHLRGCASVNYQLIESVAAIGVAIGQYAADQGCHLILTSAKYRTQFDSFVEGSELTRLVRNALVPVLCLSEEQPLPACRLALFATDLSERSAAALLALAPLLRQIGARTQAVHISTPAQFVTTRTQTELRGQFLDYIAATDSTLFEELGGITSYNEVDLVVGLLHAASDLGADFVVLGTHGRKGLRLFLEGSVTQQVLAASHLPLLTYRLPEA